MKIEKIKKIVKSLDKNICESDNAFMVAVILLSCLEGLVTENDLVEFTGYKAKLIKKILRNLIKNKILINGKIYCDWMNKKTGGLSFWMDVLVADGVVKRVSITQRARKVKK